MKIDRRRFLVASAAAAGATVVPPSASAVRAASARVVDLKVDWLSQPLGLHNPRPRFSWRLESTQSDVRQSAYQLLVATQESLLDPGRCDLWDSGKVKSDDAVGVEYSGKRLYSRQRCVWRVLAWDDNGKA